MAVFVKSAESAEVTATYTQPVAATHLASALSAVIVHELFDQSAAHQEHMPCRTMAYSNS